MLSDLRIYILTWNVVSRPPIQKLNSSLGLEEPVDPAHLPDLYFIGLQEVSSKPHERLVDMLFNGPWLEAFKEILSPWEYVKFRHIRLQGIVLLGFCKREHLTNLRGVQTAYTRTGLAGMWGNKGGTTIRLIAYGCSICIVNSHLASGDEFQEQRILDYNNILYKQKFEDTQANHVLTHDYAFWLGDLNFRINEWSTQAIVTHVKNGKFHNLLEKDQLIHAMKNGDAFSEFKESSPLFAPTYKFEVDKNDYDLKRKPAWTDRILFRYTKNAYETATLDLHQNHYFGHFDYTQSDHKPVSSSFTIKVFSRTHDAKRVFFLTDAVWRPNTECSVLYSFEDGTVPNQWDWIGLYKSNFNSTDDYDCYVWASNKQAEGMNLHEQSTLMEQLPPNAHGPWYKVTFVDQSLLVPGSYRLLYFGAQFEDILGISEPFEVIGVCNIH